MIGSHIKEIHGVYDRGFCDAAADIRAVENEPFALLDQSKNKPWRRKF